MPNDVWGASVLQLSMFTKELMAEGTPTWAALFGSDPEIDENRPREGLRRQAGSTPTAYAQIVQSPFRIDIQFIPKPVEMQGNGIPEINPVIGPQNEVSSAFSKYIRAWLGSAGIAANRMAINGTSLCMTTGVEDSYAVLSRYVKSIKIDPKTTRDLVFRINWPIESGLPGLGQVNRLTTWSAGALVVQVGGGGSGIQGELPHLDFAKLEFDINTAPARTEPLDRALMVPIFDRLMVLANETVEVGECPPSS